MCINLVKILSQKVFNYLSTRFDISRTIVNFTNNYQLGHESRRKIDKIDRWWSEKSRHWILHGLSLLLSVTCAPWDALGPLYVLSEYPTGVWANIFLSNVYGVHPFPRVALLWFYRFPLLTSCIFYVIFMDIFVSTFLDQTKSFFTYLILDSNVTGNSDPSNIVHLDWLNKVDISY